jgi:hypothetical protein
VERGILMEVRGRQGILLTRTGDFRRVELPPGAWQVGEEIAVPIRPTRNWLRVAVATAAAALIFVGVPTGYWQWSLLQPQVVMALEINPSLEFTVNGKGQVTAARGLNADGEAVLRELNWQGQSVQAVVQGATERAIALGKLDPASADGAIVVTIAPVKGEELPADEAAKLTATAEQAAKATVDAAAKAKGQEPQAQVAAVPVTATEAKEARTRGITLPEWVILKTLQESHPDLTADSFQGKGPGAIMKSLGVSPREVFSELHAERDHFAPGQEKKGGGRSHGKGQDHRASDDRPSPEQRPEGQKARDQQPGDQKTEDFQQWNPKLEDRKWDDRQSDRKQEDRKAEDRKSEERKSEDRNQEDRKPDNQSGHGPSGAVRPGSGARKVEKRGQPESKPGSGLAGSAANQGSEPNPNHDQGNRGKENEGQKGHLPFGHK